jgi:hypothetical protein
MLKNIIRITARTIFLSIVIMLIIKGTYVQGQNVSTYTFTQTSGTYTAITGGTTLIGANQLNYYSPLTNIGFDFIYHGVAFTQFSASSNGYIRLGSVPHSNIQPLEYDSNCIAFCALYGRVNKAVTYLLSGMAPNRVLTIQYPNWYLYSGYTLDTINAQIKLHETSNIIQIIYGSSNHTSSYFPQVGLNGATPADFNNRTLTTSWSQTSAGATNAATMKWSYFIYPDNGLTYTWTPPACGGTPIPGNIIASANPVCSGQNFTLSLLNTVLGTGLNFQWQLSYDGVNWTDIIGATSTSYSASQTVSTYYRCNVTCANGGLSTSSAALYVVIPTHCYCASSASGIGNSYISNITFGAINNTSAAGSLAGTQGVATGSAGRYSDWRLSSVPIPSFEKGSTASFSSTIGGMTNFYRVDVYIDFNKDGDFFDVNEIIEIFHYSNHTSPNIITSNVNIPLSADTGTTVMRVLYTESSFAFPCGTYYSNGETEDYQINITPPPICTGVPIGGTSTASMMMDSICTGYSGAISVIGSSVNSGLTYQWQSSSTGAAPWMNIVGAVDEIYTVLTQGLYYRRAVTCTNSGLSEYSSSLFYTNSAPANDECENAILLSVNPPDSCVAVAPGTLACATNSPQYNRCSYEFGNDDVWYKFIATKTNHTISLSNFGGSSTNIDFAVYNGTCDSLNLLSCSPATNATIGGFVIGDTYYIRVYTSAWEIDQTTTFNICVSVPVPVSTSFCDAALPICSDVNYFFPARVNAGEAQIGPNYGCLSGTRNPDWYYMKISTAGDLIYTMTNTSLVDIDFVCWGPYTDPATPCISGLTATGSNWESDNPHGTFPYPYGNLVDCSFDNSDTEICGIPNATVGQYYLLMITNYSNMPTNILFSQTDGTGSSDCSIIDLPISTNSPICEGQILQLNVPYPIADATYAWIGPNGFSSNLQNPTIAGIDSTDEGLYSVTITGGNEFTATEQTFVDVNPLPVAQFTYNVTGLTVAFTNTSIGATSYSWNFGSDTITDINPVYTFPSSGQYPVQLTANNQVCGAASTIQTINVSDIGIPVIDRKSMTIYPNPVSDKLIIEANGFTETIHFEILNSMGQVVFKGDFVGKTILQTANFAPGVYMVKLMNGERFMLKKIIKE